MAEGLSSMALGQCVLDHGALFQVIEHYEPWAPRIVETRADFGEDFLAVLEGDVDPDISRKAPKIFGDELWRLGAEPDDEGVPARVRAVAVFDGELGLADASNAHGLELGDATLSLSHGAPSPPALHPSSCGPLHLQPALPTVAAVSFLRRRRAGVLFVQPLVQERQLSLPAYKERVTLGHSPHATDEPQVRRSELFRVLALGEPDMLVKLLENGVDLSKIRAVKPRPPRKRGVV
mmetsp:Transcript_19375/g.56437  ORF Transcript_19375/g.56437 Transcript_19375/m.56437 type:complete len:235 (-) Transcript_19375:992-1696(-)